jgi:hypothetical protein
VFFDVGFLGHPVATGLAVLAAIIVLVSIPGIRGWSPSRERTAVPPPPGLAWFRARTYFGVCVMIAWLTGALATVHLRDAFDHVGVSGAAFRWFTLACVAVELVAYWIIWPKGTYTLDRPRDLRWQVPFGLLWGICQGLLFLSIQFAASWFVDSGFWSGVLAFVVIATYQGMWHGLYWDRYVAPEHNDPAWNLPKVLFCHVPNLAITLTYLTIVGNQVMFVAFQTIALLGSTIFMRFPRVPAKAWTVAGVRR